MACLALCLLAVRPRSFGPRPVLLASHERLGWLALAAALAHVLLLLVMDRRVVEHLKLTAPWYEWAGIIALLALLGLTLPATAAVRRRLWTGHRNFQALHVGLACLLVPLLGLHVLTTDRLLHGHIRAFVYAVVSLLALLALLRPRPAAGSPHAVAHVNRLVFGRHSSTILTFVLLALLATVLPLASGVTRALREPALARRAALAFDFPHDKHRDVACVYCHHNFIDRTGDGSCIACHRSSRADLRSGAEARFHTFCLGCHRDPPPQSRHHGPTTTCEGCHRGTQAATT